VKKLQAILSVFIIVFFLFGCYKKSILNEDNYDNDFTYIAEFALPIGETELPIAELVKSFDISLPDSLDETDTLVNFLYENVIYDNPIRLDTILYFDFSLGYLNTPINYIKNLILRLNVYNGLPFDITARPQLQSSLNPGINRYVFDADSLEIPKAQIDENGVVTRATINWDNDAYFDSTEVSSLTQINRISIPLTVYTNIVTILDTIVLDTSYQFKIQVAARFTTEEDFAF
jgi:hypothetical protein